MRAGRAAAVLAIAVLAACSSGSSPDLAGTPRHPQAPPVASPTAPASAPSPAIDGLLASTMHDRWLSSGNDEWEVWICHVPLDSTAAVYAGLQVRLPLTPVGVTAVLATHVAPFFEAISHGAYRPVFTAGGEHAMTASDDPQSCLDAAAAAARPGTRGVLAVADAEHGADQPGGFGKAGEPCPRPPCTEQQTRRSVYVGAADFHPHWGDRPPMDLVEHELGHALGWPHSGVVAGAEGGGVETYRSAIDLMSDSAAPRSVDPDRRDGADTIAVNRLTAGWLQLSDVAVLPPTGATIDLSPSTGRTGTRLALVPLDARRLLSVEVLANTGYDDHLPAGGVAVHLIGLPEHPGAARTQHPLVGPPPFTDLLGEGQSIDAAEGWHVAVVGTLATVEGDVWQVAITPNSG